VTTDGAYDHDHCYDKIGKRGATAVILTRKHAVIWQHSNCKEPPHPRDDNLRYIRKHGRKKWKKDSNYHRRFLAETTMFRLKAIFEGKLRSRKFENQAVELFVQCAALNQMI
jgi:Transposase DDE domain